MRSLVGMIAGAVLLGTAVQAQAVTLQYTLVQPDTATSPTGGPNYAVLNIEQVAANVVSFELTHSASALDPQMLSSIMLNIDPYLNGLILTPTSNNIRSWKFSEDSVNFGGANFDFGLKLELGAKGGLAAGESATWTITGDGLTVDHFLATSTGQHEWVSVVHMQRTGENGQESVHVIAEAVPEPTTMALFGLGGLALLRRKKKKS